MRTVLPLFFCYCFFFRRADTIGYYDATYWGCLAMGGDGVFFVYWWRVYDSCILFLFCFLHRRGEGGGAYLGDHFIPDTG